MSRPAATRKFGEKREAIVHAAAVLINEVGVQATTLAEVARAIGLNATSVTYYFPRKEQLVVAVYDQTLSLMEEMASEALAQPDPAARLRHLIGAHVALRKRIRAGERGLTVALSEIRTLDPEVQDPLMAHYLRVVDLVRRFFGEWQDSDERAVFSARAHILLEAVMWWPVWSLRYSVLDFPRIEERLFDVLANGLPAQQGTFALQPLAGNWRTPEGDETNQNEAFLRAATVTINERGYRGASVNRIAESLNVTKGSFYHHHEAKDDLNEESAEVAPDWDAPLHLRRGGRLRSRLQHQWLAATENEICGTARKGKEQHDALRRASHTVRRRAPRSGQAR